MLIKKDRENFYIMNWLDKYMIGHKGFIAGGCFKNIFSNEKVKDLDIFFKSEKDFKEAVEYFDGLCGEDNEGENIVSTTRTKKSKRIKTLKQILWLN